MNPADYASRGQRVSVFTQNKVWISGPAFLSRQELEWPDERVNLEELTMVDPEAKKGILVNSATVEENTDVTTTNRTLPFLDTAKKGGGMAHSSQRDAGKRVKEEKGNE